MAIAATLGIDNNSEPIIRKKGNNLFKFPEKYTVIDVETTGLSPQFDGMIEVAAVKISNGKVLDTFSTLVKPYTVFIGDDGSELYVDDFIETLTGITNDMLVTAPEFVEIRDDFMSFLGDSIIVGHNVNFDINFVYDEVYRETGKIFDNNYCDLLRISRRLFPKLPNHKLLTIAESLNVTVENSHRALDDCFTTFRCFEKCRDYVIDNNIDLDLFLKPKKQNLKEVHTAKNTFDETHIFYGKVCVFTGKLEYLKRADAAQLVVDVGGSCDNNVTAKTNYLILGDNDYCQSIKGGKSNKQKKAEKLILGGQDLQIMPESVFCEIMQKEIETFVKKELGLI